MKAISLWQPWASAIPLGLKFVETRSWGTSYRGDLLICSAKKTSREQEYFFWVYIKSLQKELTYKGLPFGCAVAVVNLADCLRMDDELIRQQSNLERVFGNWEVGRYAWILENIRPIKPFPVKGQQGLFEIDYKYREKTCYECIHLDGVQM
jgi:hypothetical protein